MKNYPLPLSPTEVALVYGLSIQLGEGRQLAITLQDGYQLYLSLSDNHHLDLFLSEKRNSEDNTFSMDSPFPLKNTTLSIEERSIKQAFDEILISTNSKIPIKQVDTLYHNFKKHFIKDSLKQWIALKN